MVFFWKRSNARVNWLYSKKVTGDVRIKLIKGNAIVVGRRSPYSKYNLSLVSFDEAGDYDQKDAEGFIKITSLRLKK